MIVIVRSRDKCGGKRVNSHGGFGAHNGICFRILCVNQKSVKWPWVVPFEMSVKIKQRSIFAVQNDSRLFFDAKEA